MEREPNDSSRFLRWALGRLTSDLRHFTNYKVWRVNRPSYLLRYVTQAPTDASSLLAQVDFLLFQWTLWHNFLAQVANKTQRKLRKRLRKIVRLRKKKTRFCTQKEHADIQQRNKNAGQRQGSGIRSRSRRYVFTKYRNMQSRETRLPASQQKSFFTTSGAAGLLHFWRLLTGLWLTGRA